MICAKISPNQCGRPAPRRKAAIRGKNTHRYKATSVRSETHRYFRNSTRMTNKGREKDESAATWCCTLSADTRGCLPPKHAHKTFYGPQNPPLNSICLLLKFSKTCSGACVESTWTSISVTLHFITMEQQNNNSGRALH
jgi:hypothetical protein